MADSSPPPLLGEIAKRLGEVLPELLPSKAVTEDLEKTVKTVAQSVFSRLELVTLQEYDAQVAVLNRTRERVQALEAKLEQLNGELDRLENQSPSS